MDAHTLEKMTVVKLREEAKKIPNISGVHGMNKAELLVVLKEHYGIPLEKKKKSTESIREIKKQIKVLKEERAKALKAKESVKAVKLRYKIKKLKRKTRKIAAM